MLITDFSVFSSVNITPEISRMVTIIWEIVRFSFVGPNPRIWRTTSARAFCFEVPIPNHVLPSNCKQKKKKKITMIQL